MHNLGRLAVMILAVACSVTFAQQSSTSTNSQPATPDAGYLSPSKYTNSFFGFSLSLPTDVQFREPTLTSLNPAYDLLLSLDAVGSRHAALFARVKKSESTVETLQRAAAGTKGQNAVKVMIGEKEFWMSVVEGDTARGHVRHAGFASALNGYVLEIHIVAADAALYQELTDNVKSIVFFDPIRAKEIAGPDSRPYTPTVSAGFVPAMQSSDRIAKLDLGIVKNDIYKNEELGFSYQLPSGWEVADAAIIKELIETGHRIASGSNFAVAREHKVAEECARVLLLTRRKLKATKNSAMTPYIALMAVDLRCFRDPKASIALDGNDIISQLVIGDEVLNGGESISNQQQVKKFTLQGHTMLKMSYISPSTVTGLQASSYSYTTSINTALNDYWVQWVLISNTRSELDDLREDAISFVGETKATSPLAPSSQPH
jgi:hypothetical protein